MSPIGYIRSNDFKLASFLSRLEIFFDEILLNDGTVSSYGLPEKNMFWDLLPYTLNVSEDDNGVSYFYSYIAE